MKSTIGIILMISGIIMAIVGHGLYADIFCGCPMQITGQPFTCTCGKHEEPIDNILIYSGIVVSFIGIGLFVYSIRKSDTFNLRSRK
jgi:hypothetical protein